MKRMLPGFLIPPLAIISALLTAAGVKATPYATSLTNDAGVVSFRLNQTTSTNDTVLVISSGGTVTNTLQYPNADQVSVLTRGLVQTNLGIAGGSFQVYIVPVGRVLAVTWLLTPRIIFTSPAVVWGLRSRWILARLRKPLPVLTALSRF